MSETEPLRFLSQSQNRRTLPITISFSFISSTFLMYILTTLH